MAQQHLTDREIQDFLDGNVPLYELDLLKQHLNGCPHCQHQIEQYRTLYVDLKQKVDFDLPPNFAESIVAQIAPKPVRFWRKAWFEFLIWIFGISGGIGAIVNVSNCSVTVTPQSSVTVKLGV